MPHKTRVRVNDFVNEGEVLPLVWIERRFVDTPEEAAERERARRQVRRERAHEGWRYAKRIARRYGSDDPRAVWARWVAWSRARYDNFPVDPRTRVQESGKLAAARKRAAQAAARAEVARAGLHISEVEARRWYRLECAQAAAVIEGAWDAYRCRRRLIRRMNP